MNNWFLLAESATDLFLLFLLVWYRLKKRPRPEPVAGVFAFLDANLVELIFAAILIPGFVGMASKLIEAAAPK